MKILFVSDGVPNTEHGGGGVTAFAGACGLAELGHKVTVAAIRCCGDHVTRHAEILLEKKIQVIVRRDEDASSTPKGALNKIFPSLKQVFPGAKYAPEIIQILSDHSYDVVVAYHWDAVAAIYRVKGVLKVALVGDPIDQPDRYRRKIFSEYQHAGKKLRLKERLYRYFIKPRVSRVQVSGMAKMMNACEIRGAFAAHHARDMEELGVLRCKYFHTPVPDVRLRPSVAHLKFRILVIGHLLGVATLSGIEVLVNQILPALDRSIGASSYEVHVVGGYAETMPERLGAGLRDHPSVVMRGQVVPADSEFSSADILLVPTPIELGIRVRIISGFSFGSLVVAHVANRNGIPELKHGVNSLLGENGLVLAHLIADVYAGAIDRDGLKENSRKTYEKYFSCSAFATELTREIEAIVGG